MMIEKFDIVVIGGGPGGYVAAIRAAQLGFKTALIEKENLGGICLNWGCIPTKSLLRSSEIYRIVKNANEYGINVKNINFDLKKIVDRSRSISSQLSNGINFLLKKNKVKVFNGEGKLLGSNKILVKNDKEQVTLESDKIILATGARARSLPNLEADEKLIWTYKNAMVPDQMPKSLLIIGSGAIGIEFASFYNQFGVDVTIVEMQDRILPAEDKEISLFAQKSFENQSIKIFTNTKVRVEKCKINVKAILEKNGKEQDMTFDKVILAVGIVGNVENIGIENTQIKIENSHILTNEWLETSEKNIYAIGDVAGQPWLAHKASHEAIVCIERIAGIKDVKPIKRHNIPGCTYSFPQIASVGLTEDQAIKNGYEIKVGRFPFIANGKALALGDTEGLIKTIFNAKTGELLGAHMIGAEVTEMIQGFVIGKNMEATELDFMHTIFPHPTLSEMMHESTLEAFGKAIHI